MGEDVRRGASESKAGQRCRGRRVRGTRKRAKRAKSTLRDATSLRKFSKGHVTIVELPRQLFPERSLRVVSLVLSRHLLSSLFLLVARTSLTRTTPRCLARRSPALSLSPGRAPRRPRPGEFAFPPLPRLTSSVHLPPALVVRPCLSLTYTFRLTVFLAACPSTTSLVRVPPSPLEGSVCLHTSHIARRPPPVRRSLSFLNMCLLAHA